MEDRTRRILETALELAERDGYDAVRLRDVAAQSEVALGTVYRRFPSKEDILVAALEIEMERMGRHLQENPITGDNPVQRMTSAFAILTEILVSKPNLARALLRAVASGVPENTKRVAQFHSTSTDLLTSMLFDLDVSDTSRRHVASMLQDIWFAKLVGWSGGLQSMDSVVADMREASEWLLKRAT